MVAGIVIAVLLVIAVLFAIAMHYVWVIGSPSHSTEMFLSIPEESADLARLPLVGNLPSDQTEADFEFGRRISDRFPVGSPEADLVAALSAEGFERPEYLIAAQPGRPRVYERLQRNEDQDAKNLMERGRRKGQCIFTWRVGWNTGETQLISMLFTQYSSFCM